MRKLMLIFAATLVCSFASSHFTSAFAQAARTWVSGVGDDGNDCSRTAPCASFAGALAKTNVGGEINCLDPGGFGGVTITNSISIICDNVEAGVLVSGANGITVSAGPNDIVYLSGLDIQGTSTGQIGISYLSGKGLYVKYCVIRGFAVAGISFAPSVGTNQLDVVDTIVNNNGGTGVLINPAGSAIANASVTMARVTNNGGDGIASVGANGGGYASVMVRDTDVAWNAGSGFVASATGGGPADMMVRSSNAFSNNTGLAAIGSGAVLRFANTGVTRNMIGVSQVGSANVVSYGNNNVDGNGTDGTFGLGAPR